MTEAHEQSAVDAQGKTNRFLFLFALGFVLVVVGIIVIAASALLSGNGSGSYGIVIFIGPIPIVIGGGPEGPWLILFGLVLAILSMTVFVFIRKKL